MHRPVQRFKISCNSLMRNIEILSSHPCMKLHQRPFRRSVSSSSALAGRLQSHNLHSSSMRAVSASKFSTRPRPSPVSIPGTFSRSVRTLPPLIRQLNETFERPLRRTKTRTDQIDVVSDSLCGIFTHPPSTSAGSRQGLISDESFCKVNR